jgi:hypothetical protein
MIAPINGAYTSYQPLEPVQEKEKNRIKDEDAQVNPPPGRFIQ